MGVWPLAVLMLLGSTVAPASVAGVWTVDTNVQGNTGSSTCTFKQDAEKITGTCTVPNGPPSAVTGEVTDTKVVFRYDITWEGNPLTLVFSGALESETTMKGALDVQPMNVPGEFSATRAK